MEVKTLTQARQEIARLERRVTALESRLTYTENERDGETANAKEWKELYDKVSERADYQDDYDTLFTALADYQTYGWTDRLDVALRMTR